MRADDGVPVLATCTRSPAVARIGQSCRQERRAGLPGAREGSGSTATARLDGGGPPERTDVAAADAETRRQHGIGRRVAVGCTRLWHLLRRRARTVDLALLGDDGLRDIGLTRRDIDAEAPPDPWDLIGR